MTHRIAAITGRGGLGGRGHLLVNYVKINCQSSTASFRPDTFSACPAGNLVNQPLLSQTLVRSGPPMFGVKTTAVLPEGSPVVSTFSTFLLE